MTQAEIMKQAEWIAQNDSVDAARGQVLNLVDRIQKETKIETLTHGWNKPSMVPNKDTYLLTICFDSTPSGYGYNGIFYSGDEDELRGVVAWRYDDASDIYKLLKNSGLE